MFDPTHQRHTNREVLRYMEVSQRTLCDEQFLTVAGPDVSKITTDMHLSVAGIAGADCGKIAVACPQVFFFKCIWSTFDLGCGRCGVAAVEVAAAAGVAAASQVQLRHLLSLPLRLSPRLPLQLQLLLSLLLLLLLLLLLQLLLQLQLILMVLLLSLLPLCLISR